jgi:hypothetical protein
VGCSRRSLLGSVLACALCILWSLAHPAHHHCYQPGGFAVRTSGYCFAFNYRPAEVLYVFQLVAAVSACEVEVVAVCGLIHQAVGIATSLAPGLPPL